MQENEHLDDIPQPKPRPEKRSLVLPLLVLGVFLFIFVGLIGAALLAFSFSSSPKAVKASKNSILEIRISAEMTEYQAPSGLEVLFAENRLYFHDYLDLLEKAADDEKIRGILLRVEPVSLGWAQAQEFRDACIAFRAQGKWIAAFGEIWTEKELYIASGCDQVYVAPEAIVMLDGLMSRVTFYKDALDWAGIGVDVAAFKEYKNFADPYRFSEMTDSHREATTELLQGIHDVFIEQVCETRKIEPQRLRDGLAVTIDSAQQGVDLGIFDKALYLDQVEAELRERSGQSPDAKLKLVKAERYYVPNRKSSSGSDQIALLVAVGGIQSGASERGAFGDPVISSDLFVRDLRAAREDDRVKAIVIRIDSPGGSALASDVIWREIRLTSESGKPVVASMGTVAASGGYYMAMACDAIFAQPTTITGSIGVISMRVSMKELYQKLKLHIDVIKTEPLADFYDPYRDLTENERQEFLDRTSSFYTSFVTKAAQSRGVSFDEFEPFARGRVWTGTAAAEHGLVDQMGGMKDAISYAAELAGISEHYRVRLMPEEKEFWDMIRDQSLVESHASEARLRAIIPRSQRLVFDMLNSPEAQGAPSVLMPFLIDIE